jgi:hypothetical protein
MCGVLKLGNLWGLCKLENLWGFVSWAGAPCGCAPLLGRAAYGAVCRDAPTLEQRGCPLELIGGNQSPRRTKGPLNTA